MQFVVTGRDGNDPDALARRLAARAAHLKLGDEMRARGEALFGVAILDADQKMIGSIYVVDFPTREKLEEWLAIEPYVAGKVWQTIDVQPCRVGPSFASYK